MNRSYLVVALLAIALIFAATAVAQDPDPADPTQPAQPDPDQPDQPDPDQPDPDQPDQPDQPTNEQAMAAAREAATGFLRAVTEGRQDDAWALLSAQSQRDFQDALTEIQTALKAIPEARRDDVISTLGSSANDMLKLEDGKAMFKLLVGKITVDLNTLRRLVLRTVDLNEDATVATLTWEAPDLSTAQALQATEEAPKRVVKEGDAWRVVLTVE